MEIEIALLEEAESFLDKLSAKARRKVYFNIDKTKMGLKGIWFEKLTGSEIWEFRTLYNQQYIRLFAFWDKTAKDPSLIICTHGLIKKTKRTPQKEIKHAESIRTMYFDSS